MTARPANRAETPTLTRWQERRRDRKKAHDYVMAGLFVLLMAAVLVYFAAISDLITPVIAP